MSDIAKSLVNAYLTTIQAKMLTGEVLEYVRAVYVCHLNDAQFLDLSTPAPFILISLDDYRPQAESLTLRSDRKEYPVTLSYFVEFPDENLGFLGDANFSWKGTADAQDDLYELFHGNTFSETSLGCVCDNISYQRRGGGALTQYHQCHLTFRHLWIDRRAAL